MSYSTWTISYDDGENFKQATAGGKLSLDANWAFILDTSVAPPAIVLAVPQNRVIDIQLNE